MTNFLHRNVGILLLLIIVMILPVVIGSGFYINIMISVAIYSVTAIGMCLLVGYAGQISLAHAAFFAIGAYLSAILTTKWCLPPSLALFLSSMSVGIIAYLIGIVVLRFKGHYLAIVTLSVLVIVEVLIKELSFITGGDQGLSGIPFFSLGGLVFDSELKIYYLCWIILICIIIFSLNLVNSKIGRNLRAIKEGEDVARILGIRATNYKAQIFVLSSVYAAISGSLYAHYMTFITPQIASLGFAFEFILMVAFGGIGSIWGALYGVAGILFLSEYIRGFDEYRLVIYGVSLVVIMMFFPNGVLQGLQGFSRYLKCCMWNGRQKIFLHIVWGRLIK
ncbi:MAG: branched-chain amino acid ABC transporter permease [Proteobacteria bacterium]|nr:branched-chain amino acid ABC transporter permease [Pseudomonadota bacterium]